MVDSVEQVAETECRKAMAADWDWLGDLTKKRVLACFEAGKNAGYDEAKNLKEYHCPVTKADLESERYKKGFEAGYKRALLDRMRERTFDKNKR